MQALLSGLSILTPAAWWGLLALAVPLLIHLFSRSRGRLVRIGHIDLVRQARRVKVTELRMTQWLLLLLRLGIVTLATLILAGLVTAGLGSRSGPTVYLTPDWIRSASTAEKDAVFNDPEASPQTRYFILLPGFPATDRVKLDAIGHAPAPDKADGSDTWPLLAERLSLEPHRGPVTVYATDRASQFGLDEAALPAKIDWRISHPPTTDPPVPAGLRALIAYDKDRVVDARLIEAALAALKSQRLPGLVWERIELERFSTTPPGVDWLIRLGKGGPEPGQFNRDGSPVVVLSDAYDEGEDLPGQWLNLPFYPFSQVRLDRLSRHPPLVPDHDDRAAWRVLLGTGASVPVLEEKREGRLRVLQFNSRFDPRWSTLAAQPEFPELLLQLLLDTGQDVRRFADARIDPAGLPSPVSAPDPGIPLPHRSLQGLLAALLVILWMVERWLSERRPRERRG